MKLPTFVPLKSGAHSRLQELPGGQGPPRPWSSLPSLPAPAVRERLEEALGEPWHLAVTEGSSPATAGHILQVGTSVRPCTTVRMQGPLSASLAAEETEARSWGGAAQGRTAREPRAGRRGRPQGRGTAFSEALGCLLPGRPPSAPGPLKSHGSRRGGS